MDEQNINNKQNQQGMNTQDVGSVSNVSNTNNSHQANSQIEVTQNPIKEKINNKYLKVINNQWMKLNPAIRKVIMVTGFIFGLLLIVAIVFSISTKSNGKVKSTPTPSSNIEQSPLPEIIINPSRYATDSAVLAAEENIKNIEKEIGSTVINDLKLAPPNLLWEINFED